MKTKIYEPKIHFVSYKNNTMIFLCKQKRPTASTNSELHVTCQNCIHILMEELQFYKQHFKSSSFRAFSACTQSYRSEKAVSNFSSQQRFHPWCLDMETPTGLSS